jgi:NADH dehydrogenase (ubiquinone) 1 alpha subcomplex subunit 13
MATKPNVSAFQDMPPKGGYPKIDFIRRLGNRGPTGAMIWAGIFGMTFWGFYQIGVTNEEKRFNRKEQRESRMAILPYLMTEQDITEMQKMKKQLLYEEEVMKGVEGFTPGASVYSQRYSPARAYTSKNWNGSDKE